MDSKSRDERQLFWLGVLLAGLPVLFFLFRWRWLDLWIVALWRDLPGIFALWPIMVGVGLIFRRTRALAVVRWPAAALLSLVALADGASFARALWPSIPWLGFWSLINALGTFCLVAWLCWLAVRLLVRRAAPSHRWVTPIVLGLALSAVAASHLRMWTLALGSGGWSLHLSGAGVTVIGFWAWKYWYGAALLVGLSLVFGGHKVKCYAAGALFFLCCWLLLWAVRNNTFPVFAITVSFLSWRFWRELAAAADESARPDELAEPQTEKPDTAAEGL